MGSVHSRRGASSRLFDGTKLSSSRTIDRHSASSCARKCATPDFWLCVMAPPSSSFVTSSCVTVLITSGPVMNMYDVLSTIRMKSVIAGEYTAPPAHGPMIAEICGITPLNSVLRRKISAYPASDPTPSWMRAPPESFSPITGAPTFAAMSMILTIFAALASDSDPPNTVKSWANTNTSRPSMRP